MKHRYKITVEDTGIREFYELDIRYPEDEVAEIWLDDAKAKWGPGIAAAFKGRVNVEELTEPDDTPELP